MTHEEYTSRHNRQYPQQDVVLTGRPGYRWCRGRTAITLIALLGFCLAGCGKNDSDGPLPPRDSALNNGAGTAFGTSVSGTLLYEFVPPQPNCNGLDYAGTVARPIRGATVQLINAADNTVIGTDVSTESGGYEFDVGAGREVFVRVNAALKHTGSPGWDVEVRDNTGNTDAPLSSRPLYVVDSSPFNTTSSSQVKNFTAATGWNGAAYSDPRAAAPFAILDTIYQAMSLVLEVDPHTRFPPLDIFWSTNNNTAKASDLGESISSGDIGTSFYSPHLNSLFLLGMADDDTEEFDRHVIIHEWGHYFEDSFSRSDSVGGAHRLGERLDMRVAFGEGWATALSGMVLEDPLFCDTFGPRQSAGFQIDMESDQFGPQGWYNEISVATIMYDLWDNHPDAADVNSLGFAPLFDVFVSDQADTPAFTSVFSYMTALKARYPEYATFVDGLLLQHNVNGPGLDAYASNETNSAGGLDVLPVYTDIVPDGTPVTLCSNSQFDTLRDGNKLSEYRYLRMQVQAPGRYTFSLKTQSPSSLPPPDYNCNLGGSDASEYSDPDFILRRNRQVVWQGESCTANEEVSTSGDLSAGDYVLSVLEFRYVDVNTPSDFPDRSCFEITANPVQ